MKWFVLITIACVLVYSCLNEQEKASIYIAGKKSKYWLITDSTSISNTKTIYRFSRNGEWQIFQKHANGLFEKYDGYDVFLIEKWKFDNGKVNIGGRNYTILQLSASNFDIKFENHVKRMIPAHDSLLVSEHRAGNPKHKFYVKKIERN